MSLRMLAPLSLLLFAVVFLVIVVASVGGGGSSQPRPEPATGISGSGRKALSGSRKGATTSGLLRGFYVVRPGDTLSTIAAKTGISIERLLVLNPNVDPQGLVSGQRIKLRE